MAGCYGYVVACGKPEMTEGRGHVDCGVDPAWWWVAVRWRDRVVASPSCLSSSAQSLAPSLPAGYVLCTHITALGINHSAGLLWLFEHD